MPYQKTITESYWTVCWKWIFPYPCKKTRKVTKWCYDFESIHIYHWLFFCIFYGCENNIEYRWAEFCIGIGSSWVYNKTVCKKKKLKVSGKC